MIYGVGVDVLDINRIGSRSSLDTFANKICSNDELEIYKSLSNVLHKQKYLAKQFSAKEAVAKSLGTGFNNIVTLSKVQIMRDNNGKPLVIFDDSLIPKIAQMGVSDVHVSISDEKHYVVAFAIAES
jgi:holo-[acyl-carrier protein] synthase